MKIKQQLVSSRNTTFAGMNQKRSITIHETGNTRKGADAQAHANLQSKGFSSSWHWQVDDKFAIQSFPHTVQCWHAGDGRGSGNAHSIAIEICVNADGHYKQAVINAAQLTRKIMREEKIPIHKVFQHHHWSRKDCPHFLRKEREGVSWAVFKSLLQNEQSVTVIQFGAHGAHVKSLQRDLNTLQFKLEIDGSFGFKTRQAVEFFQAMHQLAVDGSVGPKTSAALEQARSNPPSLPIRVLTYGKRSKAVGQLQKSLQQLNYRLMIDQSFGSETLQVVKSFQSQSKLVVDGMVGPLTWNALKVKVFK